VELKKRVEYALPLLSPCRVCPRACAADRLRDEKGECRTGRLTRVSSFDLHFGEEPPISGFRGSGAIFFSGCSLRCVFCQNFPISQLAEGRETGPEELARMMLRLQEAGAHNINLVTPTHVVPQVLEALIIADEGGLRIPLVYNSSGYDSVETLRLLDGIVDIYMPDAKYGDDDNALRLSGVEHYVETNQEALFEMFRQTGPFQTDADGIAARGVLIRHLVLPGGAAGSNGVLEFIRDRLPGAALALMSQYHPDFLTSSRSLFNAGEGAPSPARRNESAWSHPHPKAALIRARLDAVPGKNNDAQMLEGLPGTAYRAHEFPGMDRRIKREEYEEVLEMAMDFGIALGHVQGCR